MTALPLWPPTTHAGVGCAVRVISPRTKPKPSGGFVFCGTNVAHGSDEKVSESTCD